MPSEAVINALKKAKKISHISLVSGRCLDWLKELFQILDLESPCIINGGSQIINPKTHEIIWERPIYKESVREILKIIERDNIPFIVSDNGIEYENSYESGFLNPLAIKLSYFDSKEKSDKCLKFLARISDISSHKTFSWDRDRHYRMDIYITHREAAKHRATEELARILGIKTEEMIGVGDARNDVPLLNVCGLKVAMGNADKKLKSIAHYVAPTVEEDGVADVIERFILSSYSPPEVHILPQL